MVRTISRPEDEKHPDPDTEDQLLRRYEVTLLMDGIFLGVINSLIIIFGVGQNIYGIALTLSALSLGLFGLSSIFSESAGYVELFIVILNIVVLGQFIDLLTFSFVASASSIVALAVLLFIYLMKFADADSADVSA